MNQPALLSPQPKPTELDQLSHLREQAKKELDEVNKRLAAIEAEMLNHFDKKPEGTVTGDAAYYKTKVTYKLNRTIDDKVINDLDVPAPVLAQVFPEVRKLNLTALRYFEKHEPETYKEMTKAITSKPGKPSISVELIN